MRRIAVLLGLAGLLACGPADREGLRVLVPAGAAWRWADRPVPGWEQPDFDAGDWAQGRAPLGFGAGDERTTFPAPMGREDDDRVTVLRRDFELPDPEAIGRLRLRWVRDDGAVVFLNGRRILRSNVLDRDMGAMLPSATAVRRRVDGERETDLPADGLVAGRNVLAVSLHQDYHDASDLRFDLELLGVPADAPVALRRGPYLQRVTPTSAVVRWRTNRPAAGSVRWGSAPDRLDRQAALTEPAADAEVVLDGLAPATRVYYAVEAEGHRLAGGDEGHAFTTAPAPGADVPVRIWVLGDSGTADRHARAVRDGFLEFARGRLPDVWIMLGDNAYPSGSDAEYQAAVFDTYPGRLRDTALWPVLGNHDTKSSDARKQTGPYFESFTLPMAGEAGGIPSGTEAYYSFEHGPVHLWAIDSEGSRRKPHSPMLRWLREDTAAATARWRIAYWHRALFTRGSSDEKTTRIDALREVVLPLLEEAGLDLLLVGHSHAYERSQLLADRGSRVLDAGDGDPEGDGAYRKDGAAGFLSVVAGSSGTTGPGDLDHPLMARSLPELGSLVLDVDGCRLDGHFVDDHGRVRDRFRIEKGCP